MNRGLGLVGLVLALVGCGGRAYPMERVLGGEVREGVFVSPYAYEHFMRAELAVAAGDDESAVAEYAMARTGPTDDAYVIARQCAALLRLGRLDEAEALVEEGLRIDARSEPIALVQGGVAERRGEFDVAADHYRRAHDFAPSSTTPAERLAMLLGRSERAVTVLDRITESSTQPVALRARLALALHRADAALASTTALALMRVAPVYGTELLATARVQLDDGRPMMALRLLEHPSLGVQAIALRIEAFVAAGQPEAARALVLTHWGAAPAGERAKWWWISGEADLALQEALEAIAEGDAEANYWAGLAARRLGDAPASARYLALVPEGSTHHSAAQEALREALAEAGHEAP